MYRIWLAYIRTLPARLWTSLWHTLAVSAAAVPAWTGPLLAMAVASTVIAVWFKRTRRVPDGPSWLVALASIMTLAAALHLVWAFDRSLPSAADAALYALMSVLAGIGAALFRVEIDRVFGWIGTQQTLYQGMLGTLAALVLTTAGFAGGGDATGAPLALSGIALVLPFAAMLLLRRVVGSFPRVRYFQHGRDVPLPFPTKFVATSAVQGVAAGVLYMSLFLFGVPASGSSNTAAGQLIAVVLLFATLVFLRLDFNRFIYKVAFSFVAVGFLLLAALPSAPQVGFGLGAVTRLDGVESVNTRDLARYRAAKGDFAKITEDVRKAG